MKQNKSFSSSGMKKTKEQLFRKQLNRKANAKGCSCRSGSTQNKGK